MIFKDVCQFPTNSIPFLLYAFCMSAFGTLQTSREEKNSARQRSQKSVLELMQILRNWPGLCWVAREAENGKGVCANRKAIKAKGLHWFWSIEHGWTEEQGCIAQWPCQMSIVLKPFYGSTRINKNGSLCNVYLPLEGCESWLMILWSRSRKIVLIQGRGTGWFRYTSPGVFSLLWRRRNRTHCGFVW